MRVLVACEFSGIVRDAFAARGHDAWSCDLLPTERSGNHIQGDVLEILGDGWDLMIAHPPCTYLCLSGVQWLHKIPGRWQEMSAAATFFLALLNAPIPRIAIENPIPHKYAVEIIGRPNQKIQPYEFGHPEQKSTCLWLKNLPPLMSSANVSIEMYGLPIAARNRIWWMGSNKGKERSVTFPGIANAMAEQWGQNL